MTLEQIRERLGEAIGGEVWTTRAEAIEQAAKVCAEVLAERRQVATRGGCIALVS